MTSDQWITIIGIAGALIGVIVGAVISHFLEVSRNKTALILNKKIEIYSNILVKLNTLFQDEKTNLALDSLSKHELMMKIAKTLSEGRLIAGKKLEEKLRDYYDRVVLFWEGKTPKPDDELASLVLEIEQLMREEIGQGRLY